MLVAYSGPHWKLAFQNNSNAAYRLDCLPDFQKCLPKQRLEEVADYISSVPEGTMPMEVCKA